jgi:hypothetical protein
MSFWAYSKFAKKRSKCSQKRSLAIFNIFKVASGDNSVFELGHSNILEDILKYVLDINSKYLESLAIANEKSGVDKINDFFLPKLEAAHRSGDEDFENIQAQYEEEINTALKERYRLHSDDNFFKQKVESLRTFSFYGSEARSLFSERFINILIKNLKINDFDSILFNLDIQVKEPASPGHEKGYVANGKFPSNFDGSTLYLGRIFIRVNRYKINFSDTLDTITHELKHTMQYAGSLSSESTSNDIPFGLPSGSKTYDKRRKYFEDEKNKISREMLNKNNIFTEEQLDILIDGFKKGNDDLKKLYDKYEEDNRGKPGFSPGSRIEKSKAPLIIGTDQFDIAIESTGFAEVKKKGDQRMQDDPFIDEDIKEVRNFMLGSGAKMKDKPNIGGAQHNIIPAEFYTNLSGKIVSFRKDIYNIILESRKIVEMEADITTRKIMLLSFLYKNTKSIDVKKYISNLPYMDHLDDPFASRSGVGGSVRSINTHISSAISQYAFDSIKHEMLKFDDFKSRLSLISNEKLRSQVWESFSKQAEKLYRKELSKILSAARSDAEEVISILEGGELSERSFFRYFENNKGNL